MEVILLVDRLSVATTPAISSNTPIGSSPRYSKKCCGPRVPAKSAVALGFPLGFPAKSAVALGISSRVLYGSPKTGFIPAHPVLFSALRESQKRSTNNEENGAE